MQLGKSSHLSKSFFFSSFKTETMERKKGTNTPPGCLSISDYNLDKTAAPCVAHGGRIAGCRAMITKPSVLNQQALTVHFLGAPSHCRSRSQFLLKEGYRRSRKGQGEINFLSSSHQEIPCVLDVSGGWKPTARSAKL